MNYAKNIFIVLIVCSVAAYFAVLHKERRQLLTEITDLNRKLTSEKTEREKENQEAKLSMDVQLSKNDSLLQQVASLEKNLIANKKARIKEQEVAKVILDAEINADAEIDCIPNWVVGPTAVSVTSPVSKPISNVPNVVFTYGSPNANEPDCCAVLPRLNLSPILVYSFF
mgnify:CR=1 FL=1